MKLKPVLKPDIDKGEPIVKLRPDRRGPVEQGGCLGGDSKHVPRGPLEQGGCLGGDSKYVPRGPVEQGNDLA